MGGFNNLRNRLLMTLSPEDRVRKVVEALKKKGIQNDYCPRCNAFDWSVDFLEIPATPIQTTYSSHNFYQITPSKLSVVAIQCKNCGYLIFHNMDVLEGAVE